MVNFEEGFRRVGVGIVLVSLFVGVVTTFLCGKIFTGVIVGAGLVAFLFLLLRLTVYAIKGFMKKDNENNNVD